MPPIGTEVKWHSIKTGIVTRVCYSIDETINATNKMINDYSVCTVYVMYSPSYLTQAFEMTFWVKIKTKFRLQKCTVDYCTVTDQCTKAARSIQLQYTLSRNKDACMPRSVFVHSCTVDCHVTRMFLSTILYTVQYP